MARIQRKHRYDIFERDNYICWICGRETDLFASHKICNSRRPSIDHIIPQSKGGSDHPTNLATACLSCNKSKKDKILSQGASQ